MSRSGRLRHTKDKDWLIRCSLRKLNGLQSQVSKQPTPCCRRYRNGPWTLDSCTQLAEHIRIKIHWTKKAGSPYNPGLEPAPPLKHNWEEGKNSQITGKLAVKSNGTKSQAKHNIRIIHFCFAAMIRNRNKNITLTLFPPGMCLSRLWLSGSVWTWNAGERNHFMEYLWHEIPVSLLV